MQRIELPGLRDNGDWYEFGYATGDETYPLARVRIVPTRAAAAPTQTVPNTPVLPSRIGVFMRASLVDEAGQVLRVEGQLLMGDEAFHGWQTEDGKPFDPTAWIDDRAAATIAHAINVARTLAPATAFRLVPAAAPTRSVPVPGPVDLVSRDAVAGDFGIEA